MDPKEKRELMMKHYREPVHKGLVEDQRYMFQYENNESCIDEVKLMVLIQNGKIEDIRFDGEACAVCTASTSMMIETLLGKTVEEADEISESFKNMIEGKPYQEQCLEQLVALEDMGRQPSRKKCALLAWWGMDEILRKGRNENE